jgi:hypothetical protein
VTFLQMTLWSPPNVVVTLSASSPTRSPINRPHHAFAGHTRCYDAFTTSSKDAPSVEIEGAPKGSLAPRSGRGMGKPPSWAR